MISEKKIQDLKESGDFSKILIGKCFKIKKESTDKFFTFLKVIRSVEKSDGVIADSIHREDRWSFFDKGNDIIVFYRMWEPNELFHNATEILPSEYEYEVKRLLNEIGLDFFKGEQ